MYERIFVISPAMRSSAAIVELQVRQRCDALRFVAIDLHRRGV